VTSLERLIREEQELQFDRFDHDTAWALGVALVEAARAAGAPLAIDIPATGTSCSTPRCAARHLTTTPGWPARAASSTASGTRRCTSASGPGKRARRSRSRCAWTATPTPRTGGLSRHGARRRGGGTVAVSGLPQPEDHAFVVRVLSDFLGVPL
jgi:hypothetical protein